MKRHLNMDYKRKVPALKCWPEPLFATPEIVLASIFNQLILCSNSLQKPLEILRTSLVRHFRSNQLEFVYDQDRINMGCVISKKVISVLEVLPTEKLTIDLLATKSLETLEKFCYTIQKKTSQDYVAENLSKNTNQKSRKFYSLNDSGIEINENNQIDPQQFSIINYNEIEIDEKKLNDFLYAYTTNIYYYKELVFSPAFTKTQRATMHSIAISLELNAKSYGTNENRFLVISKKINDIDLLRLLKENNKHLCLTYTLKSPSLLELELDECISQDEMKNQFKNFILIHAPNNSPDIILRESANIQQMIFSYSKCNDKIAVILALKPISVGLCEESAAKKALKKLKKICTSIERIMPFVTEKILTLDDLRMKSNICDVIDKSNKGYQMLLALGWKGGGLGVNNEGITDPIVSSCVRKTEGFGLLNIDENLLKNMFKSYLEKSNYYGDIVFSSNFSDYDKEYIVKIAKTFGLLEVKILNVKELIISKNIFNLNIIEILQKNENAEISRKYKI